MGPITLYLIQIWHTWSMLASALCFILIKSFRVSLQQHLWMQCMLTRLV